MVGTNQPDEPEPSEPAAQPQDESWAETPTEPQADELDDLEVGDEEFGQQVRGAGRKLDQDMDPY